MMVQTDAAVQQASTDFKAWLDAGPSNWLRLYVNDFTPSPASTDPVVFIEATYPAYAQLALLGSWSAPLRVTPGVWQISSGPWTFATNGGGVAVTIHGWYLVRDTTVVMAERFPTPMVIQPGHFGPALLLAPQTGDQELLCSGQ